MNQKENNIGHLTMELDLHQKSSEDNAIVFNKLFLIERRIV
jgi:hypothetical protein